MGHNSIEKYTSTTLSFGKCINIAQSEYVKWICNPKMTLILIMAVFIYDMVISKMLDAASEIGTSITVLEPFIAISNSSVLLLVIPSLFIALMGDFPKVDGNSMFYIQRVGKQNWVLGQVLFAIMSAFTYLGIMFVVTLSCIFTRCTFKNEWSDVTTKYLKHFPNRSEDMVTNFITSRLYNNMKPLEAFWISFSLMFLLLVLISMFLLTGHICGKHSIGIGITVAIVCIGSACAQFESGFKWVFPSAHVLPWLHYHEIYKKQIFMIQYSYAYLMIGAVIIYVIDTILIENYDFSRVADMED